MILEKDDPETIPALSSILADGGAGVLPCDTIYGLSAVKGAGLAALRALKPRPDSKPFLLICTMEQARLLAKGGIPKDIRAVWPAPLTVILPSSEGGAVALRVPDDPFLQRLMAALGSPLYSTSVNETGEAPLTSFEAIKGRYAETADFLVRGAEGQGTVPSTLIDATSRPYRLVRQGAFDASGLIEGSKRDRA